jgi:hypothetical protein
MEKLDSKLPRRRLLYPALAERRAEDRWRSEVGLTRERLAPVPAPSDLTALVMARIAAGPDADAAMHRSPAPVRREGLPAVAGTLVVSLLFVVTSVAGLVIVAPTDALLAFGALLTAAMTVAELLRQVVVLLIRAFTSDVVILACASVPAGALLVWYHITHDTASLTREA